MSRKWRRKAQGQPEPVPASAVEALKRRRNRRLIVVGLIGLSFPILEVIAYRFRAITMVIVNRSDLKISDVKVSYPGGSFEVPEIKPGGDVTRVTRPDFTFNNKNFSTYSLTIRYRTPEGLFSQIGRAGALDYSATERYVIELVPGQNQIQIKHTTSPGFPLGAIRDILTRMGIG